MTGVLGLGTGYSSNLNQDLIDKLKSEDLKRVSTLDNLNNSFLEKKSIFSTTKTALSDFKTLIEDITTNEKSYSYLSNGDDIGTLDIKQNISGFMSSSIDVTSLARKSVHQSDKFTDSNQIYNSDITINGQTFATTGMTYNDINSLLKENGFQSSIEQVTNTESRLVIKSNESGVSNGLTITGTGITEVQSATDLIAKVDGIDYQLNKNTIDNENYTLNVFSTGSTQISIKEDNLSLEKTNNFIDAFNSLNEIMSTNKETERIFRDIKNKLITNSNNTEVFKNFDIDDKTGNLSLKDNNQIEDNFETMKDVFNDIGNYVDSLIKTNGVIDSLIKNNDERIDDNNKEIDKQIEKIDKKYEILSNQFAMYTSVITQMESSFSSLKMMIDFKTNN